MKDEKVEDGPPFGEVIRGLLKEQTGRTHQVLEVMGEFLPGLVDLADACTAYQAAKFLELRKLFVEEGVPERQATTAARDIVVSAFALQRRAGGAAAL